MISLLPLRVARELADLVDHVLNCNGRREKYNCEKKLDMVICTCHKAPCSFLQVVGPVSVYYYFEQCLCRA